MTFCCSIQKILEVGSFVGVFVVESEVVFGGLSYGMDRWRLYRMDRWWLYNAGLGSLVVVFCEGTPDCRMVVVFAGLPAG